tara:strand:- start:2674 stop:3024 length:351 start_codon:yes stop_codon:yes gene_type:complete
MLKLFEPEGYKALTAAEKSKICNGCGSKNSISGLFTPSTLYGLSIERSCNIHDWQYSQPYPKTVVEKEAADRIFLNNMNRQIEAASKWLRWLRKRRALKYYFAVKWFGSTAFWDKK